MNIVRRRKLMNGIIMEDIRKGLTRDKEINKGKTSIFDEQYKEIYKEAVNQIYKEYKVI